jgi:dTDP-4-dehydrorhamnose reductase
MTDVLLFGRNGQLGHELVPLLQKQFNVLALTSGDVDLANAEAVVEAVRAAQPALVVNAAAYTAVDLAESERDTAFAINADAPAVMAAAVREAGAAMLHFSTDFVFDGRKGSPYVEDDPTNPLNVYGASKLAGEEAIRDSGAACMTFRTSWLYATRGRNFLLTIARLLRERESVNVVNDQSGSPTWVRELAQMVAAILPRQRDALPAFVAEHSGLYHLACEGEASWFDFAAGIREHLLKRGYAVGALEPIPSSDYPTPAVRPPYSVLSKAKFRERFGIKPVPWDRALAKAFGAMDAGD